MPSKFARERAALGLPPKIPPTTAADADADADAASAFPAELVAEGLTAEKVDAMLQQEDEFVIGDPLTEAELEAEAESVVEAESLAEAIAEAETEAAAEAEADETIAATEERPDADQKVQKPE
ncbi:hypothetical protein EKO27_g3690 [Xylaria grammica]|uniref:Uncharacterized protein n=1 Tax=Xylaria grammica TaxID=363999 RepID=A0A439DAE5_9PEZI|nr:hypothetical protein EKO27_g3690 [Xylaria grammica]